MIWTPAIKEAAGKMKATTRKWKIAGSPLDPSNELNISRKESKKDFRSLQRQQQAVKRRELYQEITNTHADEQKTFYKLVNHQRKTISKVTDYITVDNIEFLSTENIIEGWQLYFERLSEPKDDPRFINAYEDQVLEDHNIIEDICTSMGSNIDPISQDHLIEIINNMKRGKAADYAGITAEHFLNAMEEVAPYLTMIVNAILQKREVPPSLKTGILTPILKKGKDKTLPTSYRGITVTPLVGKIIEAIIKEYIDPILTPTQHPMQRGFTENTSPLMAALLITEAINDLRDRGEGLYLATLDAEKAFDVVWHASLLRKLFIDGIQGDSWLLIKSLHDKAHTQIKWGPSLSEPIEIKQGIRQGAKLSTTLYKRYNNGLFTSLEDMNLGINIGTENITSPTCADDLALLEQQPARLQSLATAVYNHSCKDRFKINGQKSEIVPINIKASQQQKDPKILLGNAELQCTTQTKHLGIERNTNNTPDVSARIKLGRQTTYALMGAGMHGCNGLSPVISYSMWTTFVIPRILHGLEMLDVRKKDLQALETFQRKTLKHLQGLPQNTATAAVYHLLGAIPVEGLLDQRFLSTFGNILQNENSTEFRLAKRQLLHKDETSYSWFIKMEGILEKYNLPHPLELLENPPKKEAWKNLYKTNLKNYWTKQQNEEIEEKNSLKYLTTAKKPGQPHHIWKSSKSNPADTKKAMIKARLATGTYRLQTDKHRFTKGQQTPTCKLCQEEQEDTKHFLLKCKQLAPKREPYLRKLKYVMQTQLDTSVISTIENSEELMEQLLVDCTHQKITAVTGSKQCWLDEAEAAARGLIYALHMSRTKFLRDLYQK